MYLLAHITFSLCLSTYLENIILLKRYMRKKYFKIKWI